MGKQGPEFFPSPCFTAEQRISHAAGDARGGATGIAAVVGATSGKRVARGHIGDDLQIESEGILDVFDGGYYGHDFLSSLPNRFLLIRPAISAYSAPTARNKDRHAASDASRLERIRCGLPDVPHRPHIADRERPTGTSAIDTLNLPLIATAALRSSM